MDLSFTAEELAFRDEARRFFRSEIPQSIRDKVAEGEGLTRDEMITSQRILNARGWATVNWPACAIARASSQSATRRASASASARTSNLASDKAVMSWPWLRLTSTCLGR